MRDLEGSPPFSPVQGRAAASALRTFPLPLPTMRTSLFLCLVFAVVAAGCDTTGTGSNATGTVTNTFSRPVQGATVVMSDGATAACTATTNADGEFECDVPAGAYTVTVTASGYGPATASVTVGEGGGTVVIPALVGLGSISATLVNGLTGAPIPNAAVECRRQIDNATTSGVEFTATSDAAALLAVTGVFTGNARCTAAADGTTIPLNITIGTTTTGTVVATPPPAAGSFRVVLTWGENPSDLDSHLTGPITGGSDRFHVYYSDDAYEGHNLDVDDVSSFGPETITIVPAGVNGMYRYSVHNYSEQGSDGASNPTEGIAASGAEVRLYDANGLIRTYTPPPATAANGGDDADTWRVFELTVNGSNVSIAGAEPNGMGYFQATGSGDVTVFLTGGPAPTTDKRLAL